MLCWILQGNSSIRVVQALLIGTIRAPQHFIDFGGAAKTKIAAGFKLQDGPASS